MSGKAKSFKKSNKNRRNRVFKTGSASEAIGKIEKDSDTFILTYGQFSFIDAIVSIIDQIGPSHVSISTWTAAHADLTRSAELMSSSDFLSFRMIVDRSFKTRQPEYYYHMIDLFGEDCIRAIRTHAKFAVIKNDNYNIAIRTSMNLNGNPRLENIEISENKEFADFFESIVDSVFEEVKPSELKSDIPSLNTIENCSLFPEIEATKIKRHKLKEASFTHEINT